MPQKNNTILKRIELRIRKIIIALLRNNSKQVLVSEPEDIFKLKQDCKILILRQDRIGDVLISVPLLRRLRLQCPMAQLDIILGRKNLGASNAVKRFVDNIWLYDKNLFHSISLIKKIRKLKYDLTIDLFDNTSTTSTLLTRFARSRFSLGIDKENSYIYTHIVPRLDRKTTHIVERIAVLMLPFGVETKDIDLSLEYPIPRENKMIAEQRIGAKRRKFRLGINLAGSNRAKFWGINNNIELIRKLNKENPEYEIVIFATKEYAADVNEIIGKTKAVAAPSVQSLDEYAAMLSTCDIIITPDTAAVHFAAAWKIPCIALYQVHNKAAGGMPWTPYDSPHSAITTDSGSLTNITVAQVIDALKFLNF